MVGKRIAMLAIATLLGAAACSESGSVKGAAAPKPTTTSIPSSQSAPPDSSSPASTSEASADTVALDPCKLVTKSEARAIAGIALDDAVKAGEETDSPSCTYTSPPTGATAQVEVHTGPGAKKYYDLERDGLQHAMQAAPGIGDEAWTDKDDMSIFVRHGDNWFVIHLVVLDDVDKYLPRLRAAAKVAVTRT